MATKTAPTFEQKLAETERLCKTDTATFNATSLEEWMAEGNWQTMTAEEMAAEWDSLNEDAE